MIALSDLKRRTASEINGSKSKWAAAIVVVNAFGAVPVLYLLRGRHRARSAMPS